MATSCPPIRTVLSCSLYSLCVFSAV
uniref:Uncharacterized protein n=1 Tax=Anguilla anguilla TaxID=7936 RepID=A0A0E9S8Z5_ANGAN